jgi:wyosine [tRNA(Phe)-imidazoG37] synthetase (radical SAM superfamily)
MLLELKKEVIYGPVNSRRLGPSLGINVIPSESKVCSFDCIYCQYGFSRPRPPAEIRQSCFFGVEEILAAVAEAVQHLEPRPGYLTFSGNGEASLHPDFKELVVGVNGIRDRFSPTSKTAILSNSTTVNDPAVREALALLDLRIMKLDAGDERMLTRYNRQARGITLEEIVTGLAELEGVTIQALFSDGPAGNFNEEHLESWLHTIKRISPLSVQLYTLARPTPTHTVLPLAKEKLQHIQERLEQGNIPALVF